MSVPPAPWPAVADNRWPDLDVPALGSWRPRRRVSVIVVARRTDALGATVAALGRQTYPADLLDVVAVADGAAPPTAGVGGIAVTTPAGDEPPEAAGARQADGELLCFLAAGAPVGDTLVEAHARWHHAASGLVTLGWLPEGGWVSRYREQTDDLAAPGPDHFRAVDLRGLGVAADLLEAVGGIPSAGEPAATALDLGWRLWCAGAVFVPEPGAVPAADGVAPRPPRCPRLVPWDRRPQAPPAAGAVPSVLVHVAAAGAPAGAVAATVHAVLGADVPGVAVHVEGAAGGEGFDDPRVTVAAPSPVHARAPVQVWVPPSVVCAPATLGLLAEQLSPGGAGALSLVVPDLPPAEGTVLAAATRALSRARRVAGTPDGTRRPDGPVLDAVTQLFGHRWVGGGRVGFARWHPGRAVILGEPPAAPRVEVAVARQLSRRLDESDDELATARARVERLEADRAALRARLRRARRQVTDRDRRLARRRSEVDEYRFRAASAERRASTAERRATALAGRRAVRVADALGKLLRARRPGQLRAALRQVARAARR